MTTHFNSVLSEPDLILHRVGGKYGQMLGIMRTCWIQKPLNKGTQLCRSIHGCLTDKCKYFMVLSAKLIGDEAFGCSVYRSKKLHLLKIVTLSKQAKTIKEDLITNKTADAGLKRRK